MEYGGIGLIMVRELRSESVCVCMCGACVCMRACMCLCVCVCGEGGLMACLPIPPDIKLLFLIKSCILIVNSTSLGMQLLSL